MLPEPKFRELDKVRVAFPDDNVMFGFVIGSKCQEDKRWHIYKISMSETEQDADTFDNWVLEEWMARMP